MKTKSLCLTCILLLGLIALVNAQWNANPFENNPICTADEIQHSSKAISDGNGGSVIVWYDYRDYYINIYAQHIDKDGYIQWPEDGINITSGEYDQFLPEIISDGNGGYIIVWLDERNTGQDIYAQKINNNGEPLWADNGVLICDTPLDKWAPMTITDNAGGAIICWYDYRNGAADIYTQRIDASGYTQWETNGVAICTAPERQSKQQLIPDGMGGAIITWNDNRNSVDYNIYAQHITSGGTLSWANDGVIVCDATEDQLIPEIVPDPNSGAIITWTDYRSGNWDIYAQRLDDQGVGLWGNNGAMICNAPMDQQNAKIVSDGSNSFIITWDDNRNTGNGKTGYDIYAQKINLNGNVEWVENGVGVCNSYYNQFKPSVAPDGHGGIIVSWEDYRSDDSYDIYSQRLNASGSLMWPELGVAVAVTPQLDQGYCIVVSDGNGGAIMVWQSYFASFISDIFASHLTADGKLDGESLPLPLPNHNVSSAANNQLNPQVIPYQDGGTIVVWQDGRHGDYDIYAQRFDFDGIPQWAPDGVAVCTNSMDQIYPMIVPDGNGGAVIAWHDKQIDNHDVYAQKIDGNGNIQWQSEGVAICTTPEHQLYIDLTGDGTGGAIIVWSDFRGGYYKDDIYAQHLASDGSVLWETNGINITPKDNQQTNPQIVSDDAGGAYIAWYEASFDKDIYAQRIDGSGNIYWDQAGLPVANAWRNQNWEHPASQRQYMVEDGMGNAQITWVDEREIENTYKYKIYTQLFDNTGTTQWDALGVPVCIDPPVSNDPFIISDEDGGVITVWWDNRNEQADLFTQRVISSGTTSWTTGGVAICTSPEKQSYPVAVTDGANGAIYAWQDLRDSTTKENIYVQRVDADGTIQWEENGILMCNAISHQIVPKIETDGQGGAFVVWSDNRSGTYDVVMGIVRADGTIVPGSLAVPERNIDTELALYPNPAGSVINLQSAVGSLQSSSVQIFDFNGRLLIEEYTPAGTETIEIDVSSLVNGIYFCRINSKEHSVTKKLIIQK